MAIEGSYKQMSLNGLTGSFSTRHRRPVSFCEVLKERKRPAKHGNSLPLDNTVETTGISARAVMEADDCRDDWTDRQGRGLRVAAAEKVPFLNDFFSAAGIRRAG